MEFNAALDRIVAWLDGAEDEEYDIKNEVLADVFRVHDYDRDGDRKVGTIDAQSHRFKPSKVPAVFYRASFLFGEVGEVGYKKLCLCLTSPDQKFVAALEFFKYELGLYLSVAKEHHQKTGSNGGVIAGAPGSNNGCSGDEASMRWFQALVRLLERKWMVYGGNGFEV